MLICCNREQFFVIFLSPTAKLLPPDWSSGKILSPDWLSTTVLHFVGFCILCPKKKKNKFFEVLSKFDSLSRVLCIKIHGNQVLQLGRKFLKVNFSVSHKKQQKSDYLCQKLKTWIGMILFCLVEKLKSVMASKCFQRTITEHESVLLMGGRSRKKLLRKFLLWIHRLLFLAIYVRAISKR